MVLLMPLSAVCDDSPAAPDQRAIDYLSPLVVEELLQAVDIDTEESSSTTIHKEDIDRRQSSSIYQVIQDVPGVLIEGGPRASGTRLNIRGFSNNEDLMVRIDGAVKTFDKYRYGSGLSIEPELLKQVTVSRGSLGLRAGSGRLGGEVRMVTKDAGDFLTVDQRYGGQLKFAYNDNNDESLLSATVYSAPTTWLDIIANINERRSNDITLSTGDQLENSAENPRSHLLKIELYPSDIMMLALSTVRSRREGIEYFDTQSLSGAGFGEVFRAVDDRSTSLSFEWMPDSDWFQFTVNLAHSQADFTESAVDDNRKIKHDDYQTYDYDIWSANLANRIERNIRRATLLLDVGADVQLERRETRDSINPFGTAPDGETQLGGVYIAPSFSTDPWRFEFALRYDYHSAQADDEYTVERLQRYDLPVKVVSESLLHSAKGGVELFEGVEGFVSYREGRRYPKLNQAFGVSVATAQCLAFLGPKSASVLPEPYRSAQICSDLYRAEEAETVEWGVSFQKEAPFYSHHRIDGRLAWFDMEVDYVLESLRDSSDDPISQPGYERRRGLEAEFSYRATSFLFQLTYTRLKAREYGLFALENSYPIQRYTLHTRDIYSVPPAVWTWGVQRKDEVRRLQYGFNVRRVASSTIREAVSAYETRLLAQESFLDLSLFVDWKTERHWAFSVAYENVLNAKYRLDNGFDLAGNYNAGPALKSRVTLRF